MMDDEMGSMHDDQDDMMMTAKSGIDLKGEIVIEVIEANNLTNKEESDIVGDVSDPYCAIFLDRMEENRTKTIQNSLNPKWEEKFIVVVNGKHEDLQLQLFDYDPKKTVSDHLGLAKVDIKSLTDEKKKDLWIPLQQNTTLTGNKKKDIVTGNLHIKIQYLAKGGEEKRKAEKEQETAQKEVEELKRQIAEMKKKSETSSNEDKQKLQNEIAEKKKMVEEARKREEEFKLKAEEEKKKLVESFNKQSEEEKKRSASILKEKEEAENRLKEALLLIEKIKKEIAEKNHKEIELLKQIDEEKEVERRLREKELQQTRSNVNVTNIPTVNFGGDFKPAEMAQPTKLFSNNICNIAAAGNTIYALRPTGDIVALTKAGICSDVPGRLVNMGVGGDGTLVGVDQTMQIWKWSGSSWSKLQGLLTMISVGDKKNIWGVGYGGGVWKFDYEGQRWNQEPGKMKWISAGSDGEVWAVSVTGDVYRWESGSWRVSPLQNAILVTVATKENIWAINEQGVLHQFTGSSWRAYENWGRYSFVDIAEDSLFVIDQNNNVYTSESMKAVSLIEKIAIPRNKVPGRLSNLDIGGNILGGIDPEGKIWTKGLNDNNWVNLPGILKNISVGQDDDIWGCTTTNQLFHWEKEKKSWVFSGNLHSISVGNSRTIAGVGDGESLWRCLDGRWEKLPGAGNQIAIGSDGEMWVHCSNNSVYRWVKSNWAFIPSPPATFIAVGSAGNVVILSQEDGLLYYFDGTAWFPLKKSKDLNLTGFSINANGVTFSIDKSGDIFSSL